MVKQMQTLKMVWTHFLHLHLCHCWHNGKLQANAHVNVNVDAKCEQTLRVFGHRDVGGEMWEG